MGGRASSAPLVRSDLQSSKRRQLTRLAAGLTGGMLLARPPLALAQARINPSDVRAQALNYRDDANLVDQSNSRYLRGSMCANCVLYQGKPGDVDGNCPIFQKLVSARGWCNSYVRKGPP